MRWMQFARRGAGLVVLALAGVCAAMAATASGTATVQVAHNAKLGNVLATAQGLTLYRYTLEKRGGAVKCAGACAKAWPPLLVKIGAKPTAGSGVSAARIGTVKRPDGTLQVTYAGFPLYRFSGDKRGTTKGQGAGATWFAVTPTGQLAKTPTQTTTTTIPPTDTTPTVTYR
jgi:predicted lipoprotein with Yx(FWY)xxD motif